MSTETVTKVALFSAWIFATVSIVLAVISAVQTWPSWLCVFLGFSASLYLDQFSKRYRKYRKENDGSQTETPS